MQVLGESPLSYLKTDGSIEASGLERTRREMLTICKSLDPVGEEILRGLDLGSIQTP